MLWKHETEGLQNLPISRKISITIFLCVVGVGYLFGFFNILLTHGENDGESGLSITDIRIAYNGAREKTAFEKSIDGSMKTYFTSDADYDKVKQWLADGFEESEFETIKPILDTSCSTCHSEAAQVAGVVTETYEDNEPYLVQDTGKSIPRLISTSHNHILSAAVVVFILVSIMCATTYPMRLKVILCAFSYITIALDVGSWWLAKASPGMAFFVIVGGASMGVSWGLLIILPMIEMWFKKISKAEADEE